MPRCPYCDRWFRTKRGPLQHIYRSHPYAPENVDKNMRTFYREVNRSLRQLSLDISGGRKRQKRTKRRTRSKSRGKSGKQKRRKGRSRSSGFFSLF